MSRMLVMQAEGMKDLVADVPNQTMRPNQNRLFTPHTADIRRTPLEKDEKLSDYCIPSVTLIDDMGHHVLRCLQAYHNKPNISIMNKY